MGWQCFAEPQVRDSGLAPDTHRVKLAGPIEALSYPPLCPNCGAPADEPLTISKAFHDDPGGDTPSSYVVVDAHPLFCRPCMDRHRAEMIAPTSADVLKTVLFSEPIIPAVFMSIGGLFLLGVASRAHGNMMVLLLFGGVAAVLLLAAWSSWRDTWYRTQWKRVPAPTSVSRAFDFGHDESSMYGTVPRTYAFCDAGYAEAFGRLNAELDARWLGPEQKERERRRTWIAAAIIAGLALLALWAGPDHG